MKVYCEAPLNLSKAMGRVVAALKRHAPRRGVEFVSDWASADLIVLHVIGHPETERSVRTIRDAGRQYVIAQYCMRSTQKPSTADWRDLWTNSRMVWSYYDLLNYVRQDGENFSFPFCFSPMGVDPIFVRTEPMAVKMYTIMTSGYVAESESVREVAEAVRRVEGRFFHLGPREAAPNADVFGLNISDYDLADVYTRSAWVSGLRRAEGFEMPAAEGLCAGARPIVFDAPHYHQWYDEFADFVLEGSPDEVTDAVVDIFQSGLRPVTNDERLEAAKKFDWSEIVSEFWKGVLA